MESSLREARWLAATRLALAVFWSIVVFLVLTGSISENPIRRPFRTRAWLAVVAPEGWAFFTRDPREPQMLVYKRNGSTWSRASLANSMPANLFGLRRGSRLVTAELQQLLQDFPKERWVPCRTKVADCLNGTKVRSFEVEKKTQILRKLCGETVVQLQRPVPWAWSRERDRIQMPSALAILRVRCS